MPAHTSIILVAVPPNIRHALTRWMIEPAPGVFVGNITSRVRDELWYQIQAATDGGAALMIAPAPTEQGFSIKTCGQERRRVADLDGLFLVATDVQLEDNERTLTTENQADAF